MTNVANVDNDNNYKVTLDSMSEHGAYHKGPWRLHVINVTNDKN